MTMTPPTPPRETDTGGVVLSQESDLDGMSIKFEDDSVGYDTDLEESTPEEDTQDWKTTITNAIDTDRDSLLAFLDDFNIATSTGGIDHSMTSPTAPAALSIRTYLLNRGIKSMTIGPNANRPSVVSVFDEGEGPCLVLNGLLGYATPDAAAAKGIPACTAGTAAIVAAYAYLHHLRQRLVGTVVLEAISDDEAGSQGGCNHLLHTDERRTLWRGDCMLSCNANGDGLSATCATHPVATALSNNWQRVLGSRPRIPFPPTPSHCRLWAQVGVPSFSLGLRNGEKNEEMRDGWLGLVKVLTLTAWDYLSVDE